MIVLHWHIWNISGAPAFDRNPGVSSEPQIAETMDEKLSQEKIESDDYQFE